MTLDDPQRAIEVGPGGDDGCSTACMWKSTQTKPQPTPTTSSSQSVAKSNKEDDKTADKAAWRAARTKREEGKAAMRALRPDLQYSDAAETDNETVSLSAYLPGSLDEPFGLSREADEMASRHSNTSKVRFC